MLVNLVVLSEDYHDTGRCNSANKDEPAILFSFDFEDSGF